jgi:prepilin-type N-terminal cleavage/methylation domain-containing protein
MNKRKRSGFTVVELVICIAVMAILVAIMIPVLSDKVVYSQKTTCDANIAEVKRAYYNYLALHPVSGDKEAYDLLFTLVLPETFPSAAGSRGSLTVEGLCPNGGTVVAAIADSALTMKCSVHDGALVFTVPESVLNKYEDIQKNWDDYKKEEYMKGHTWLSNDNMRYCFAQQNGGKWPQLVVDGKTFYIQPYIDIYGKDSSGDMFVFANTNGDPNRKNWAANYIYDRTEKKWYTSPSGKTLMINDKSFEEVKDLMEQNGWVEVKDYIEQP